jgi:hypothetical protein
VCGWPGGIAALASEAGGSGVASVQARDPPIGPTKGPDSEDRPPAGAMVPVGASRGRSRPGAEPFYQSSLCAASLEGVGCDGSPPESPRLEEPALSGLPLGEFLWLFDSPESGVD